MTTEEECRLDVEWEEFFAIGFRVATSNGLPSPV